MTKLCHWRPNDRLCHVPELLPLRTLWSHQTLHPEIHQFFYPYIQITFNEYHGDGFERSKAYAAIERYLNANSTKQAKRLQANVVRDSESIVLSMADTRREDEKRYFMLTFHKRYRDLITNNYLKHVLDEGKAITVRERRRKLYTNNKSESWNILLRQDWQALEAWIPPLRAPGTGKSTMIAAMANLLKYDVYDLELTAVKDNTELRKLLIDTGAKGEEKGGQEERDENGKKKDEEKDEVKEKLKKLEEERTRQARLRCRGFSTSSTGSGRPVGERLIIFTTNYVEKLDPALIRRGRMDMRIELSYCGFEAFKFLAKNYLGIDSHELFETVRQQLEETKMTPADVAENLMPKSGSDDAETCLRRLMKALEEAKEEEIRRKAEEEEKRKAEEEEKQKAEQLAKE
ncbi:UNVERIFIED_CONTAM: AAA-ATPase ASD, mitochondrial [Sesamum angustifolium]|uniref:AAA-ATPase ASD, mitochondrial n=1 Tax=Sesamum angustifolium TaxID=2727405 RepID=A0AAW2ILT1_9LAMI